MCGSRGMYVIMLRRGKELIELAGFFVSPVHTHIRSQGGKRLFLWENALCPHLWIAYLPPGWVAGGRPSQRRWHHEVV